MVGTVEKMAGIPHGQRRGWLKNSNPPGDLSQVRRCGAKNRRAGRPDVTIAVSVFDLAMGVH
jgi:hypothetical protein